LADARGSIFLAKPFCVLFWFEKSTSGFWGGNPSPPIKTEYTLEISFCNWKFEFSIFFAVKTTRNSDNALFVNTNVAVSIFIGQARS
jgi:hypothetical protein